MRPVTTRTLAVSGFFVLLSLVLGFLPPPVAVHVAQACLIIAVVWMTVRRFLGDAKARSFQSWLEQPNSIDLGLFHTGGVVTHPGGVVGLKPNEQPVVLKTGEPPDPIDGSWLPEGWALEYWQWSVDESQSVLATRLVDLGEGRESVIRVHQNSYSPLAAATDVQRRVMAVVASSAYKTLQQIEDGIRLNSAPLPNPPRFKIQTTGRQESATFKIRRK